MDAENKPAPTIVDMEATVRGKGGVEDERISFFRRLALIFAGCKPKPKEEFDSNFPH